MRNPWLDLPEQPPFVLPDDAEVLERIRYGESARPRLEVPPSPFAGCPERSRVVLLLLNPGFKDADIEHYDDDAAYREILHNSLSGLAEPPFWPLDSRIEHTGAYRWTHARCRELAQQVGFDTLRKGLMQVQYFPYKSVGYQHRREPLPSQQYGFWLVRQGIAAGKLIIVTRSLKQWLEAVPELEGYPYIRLRNPRSPFLTPGNMGQAGYDTVVARLTR